MGYGANPVGDLQAFLVTIPEPGTALLLGSGVAALALGTRLRGGLGVS